MLLTLPHCVQLTGQLPTQGDFGLSLLQDGILPAAFMVRPSYLDLLAVWHTQGSFVEPMWRQVGLLISSPLFAEASKHCNAFRLIAIGLGVWTLATAGCGVAVGARLLAQARSASGCKPRSACGLQILFTRVFSRSTNYLFERPPYVACLTGLGLFCYRCIVVTAW